MRRVLVTGANKGIGFAIVEGILEHAQDTYVLLGARDKGRGEAALQSLLSRNPSWKERVERISLDVADSTSVKSAAARVREQFVELSAPLFGIVNNAGTGLPSSDLKRTLEVNTYGMQRVCEAFIPLLEPHGGRIVNLTSASGPNYVSSCSRERQQLLVDPAVRWETIEAFMEECLSIRGETLEYRSRGLGSGEAYGISKALANAYTVQLAREYPQLMVNACTPGFIETDLTRPFAAMRGVSPAEMGMKSPREGTVSPLFLLFGTPHGSGHYYGSDALRSPLDCYRSPGDPEFMGA